MSAPAFAFDAAAGCLDIHGAERVDFRIRADGRTIWLHDGRGLRLRICSIDGPITFTDERPAVDTIASARVKAEQALRSRGEDHEGHAENQGRRAKAHGEESSASQGEEDQTLTGSSRDKSGDGGGRDRSPPAPAAALSERDLIAQHLASRGVTHCKPGFAQGGEGERTLIRALEAGKARR